jgi:hypothetical protein
MCHKKPTDKPPRDERWYVPLSSVQSLDECRAEVIIMQAPSTLCMRDACTIRREVYCQSSLVALLTPFLPTGTYSPPTVTALLHAFVLSNLVVSAAVNQITWTPCPL